GATAAEHAALGVEGFLAVDLGATANGAFEADEAGARRAGLDRAEGPGEGPPPPLRVGQRLRGGRRALPGRRAGAGVPAFRVVPPPQASPADQGPAGAGAA